MEWTKWHADYDDPDSPLSRRRVIVRKMLRTAIDEHARERLVVISICAGDGHDLISEASVEPGRIARALLVESDPALAARCEQATAASGLSGIISTRCADAAQTSIYSDHVPADIVLACGIFGNISDDDVYATITHLPELISPASVVIWTRSRRAPDLTPSIREQFDNVGFTELSFTAPPDVLFTVGTARYDGTPRPFVSNRHLFTFIK